MEYKHIKAGAEVGHIGLPLLDALLVAAMEYHRLGYKIVVTEVTGGKHRPDSLHYHGLAADLRTRHVRTQDIPVLARALRSALGKDYDVVVEPDHIHLEYDPAP